MKLNGMARGSDDNIRQQTVLPGSGVVPNPEKSLKLRHLKENISSNIARTTVLGTGHTVRKFLRFPE
jgi:hypothetical protein